jgi:hypothetical protein
MRHQVPKLTILKHAHLDAPLFAEWSTRTVNDSLSGPADPSLLSRAYHVFNIEPHAGSRISTVARRWLASRASLAARYGAGLPKVSEGLFRFYTYGARA